MKGTIVIFALIIVCSIPFYFFYGESNATFLFGNLAQFAGLAFAFRSFNNLSSTFSRNDPLRKAANQIALGMLIWVLGQALEMYCELVLNLIAYGTIADAIWVVGYFPISAGLHSICKERRKAQLRSIRPFLIISAITYALLFFLLIWPQLLDKDQRLSETILDFLYPTLDFVLLVQCVFIIWHSKPKSDFFLFGIVLATGLIVTMTGDGVISLVKDFHSMAYSTVDIYYYASYFLMALAADFETSRRKNL